MSYTETGYSVKTETQIIRDKEDLFKNLMGTINYSVSDMIWQYMKLSVYERREIEAIHSIAEEMMSISNASGVFLDKWGIECGILRKGATKSQGYVEATVTLNGADYTIPEGTIFASNTNSYASDEDTTIPYEVWMTKTKTGESLDFFSSNFDEVNNIVEIRDENNNVINSAYYSLDPTYKNNIRWLESSSAVLVMNELYKVILSGSVTYRVEVSSVSTGIDSHATIGEVTRCIQFPALTVTNEEEIDGGKAEEGDSSYKERLLEARRRTFTIDRIKSIILGLEGVKTAKVYQDVGTDQTSIEDWDNPSYGATILPINTLHPVFGQNFVPGDQIATLGRITLKGRPVNNPPGIILGVKRNIDDTGEDAYFDTFTVQEWDLDQSLTGWRDIEFNVHHNGMDKTKTYRFDVWLQNPNNPSFDYDNNYWLLRTSDEGYLGAERGAFISGAGNPTGAYSFTEIISGIDFAFKTHFNGAGFTAVVACDDGYGFTTHVRPQIETYLDYVGSGDVANPGHAPICIQSQILEANEVLVDVQGVIYITTLAEFQNVRREVNESIEEYLESLNVGDNVIYSRIFQAIMNHEQVYKLEQLYIKRDDQTEWVQHDLGILDNETADLGSRSFQLG